MQTLNLTLWVHWFSQIVDTDQYYKVMKNYQDSHSVVQDLELLSSVILYLILNWQ